jgi:predicted nucleic acid-binding protein
VAVVLDSDAVVGFIDRADGLHDAADAAIRDLAGEQRLVVSVVTYAEVTTGARIGHHDLDQVKGFFGEVISRIVPVDVEIADRAAELRAGTKSLQMPDALIVATADLDSEVDLLLTGDRAVAKLEGLRCDARLLASPG